MEELFTRLLDLPDLEVTLAEVGQHTITLHCRSTLADAHCPSCLKKCNFVKDTYTRQLRDLSISGKKVILSFTVRQFVCKDCNRHFHEQFDFAPKSSSMTKRYEDFIYYRCQGSDLSSVAAQEGLIAEWKERHTAKPNRFTSRFIAFFEKWKSYILNYFTYRKTTSIIEGINNKLKVIKRRAYGFLSFESFRLRAINEFILS